VELDSSVLARTVEAALAEDLGEAGDITTDAVIDSGCRATGRFVAREELVLAGLPVAREVFRQLDAQLSFRALRREGERIGAGECVAVVSGGARAILRGERTSLNFLMRMCGVARAADSAVAEVAGTGCVVLDTRKTAPGLRQLDKYATACGGMTNHRMGLYDGVMVKDTHLDAGCGLEQALRRLFERGHDRSIVTVEVRRPAELEQAIAGGAGRAILDNMDLDDLRRAVQIGKGRIVLEASGGLRPGLLRAVAETGVDCISLGWITHSAPAANLALEMEGRP